MQFAECRVVSGGRLTIGPQVSDRARFPWHRTSSTLTRRPARHQTACSWHRSVADSIEAMTAIRRPHPDDTVLSSYVGVSGRSSAGNDRDDTVLHPSIGKITYKNQSPEIPARFGCLIEPAPPLRLPRLGACSTCVRWVPGPAMDASFSFSQDSHPDLGGPHDYTRAVLNARPESHPRRRTSPRERPSRPGEARKACRARTLRG